MECTPLTQALLSFHILKNQPESPLLSNFFAHKFCKPRPPDHQSLDCCTISSPRCYCGCPADSRCSCWKSKSCGQGIKLRGGKQQSHSTGHRCGHSHDDPGGSGKGDSPGFPRPPEAASRSGPQHSTWLNSGRLE